jgi:hypothetical protein
MTVVVVIISFYIIVSCIFISLLLVTVGVIYSRAGNSIIVTISILFDGENISFDASLVVYINSTSIPPIIIMNRIYENQNLLYIFALIKQTIVVCISSVNPLAIGCFVCVALLACALCSHLQRVTTPDAVLIQFDLLMMSIIVLETCRGI